MRKLATLLSPLAIVLIVACSSKKEETPTPTPGIDASTPGCDQNPSAPGCEEDEDSGGGTDGGGGTDSGSDTAVAIDPALLAGAEWGGTGPGITSHRLTFTGGPTSGTVTGGRTVTAPGNTSCGPAAIYTFVWSGTWSYSASSMAITVEATDATAQRTECADVSLDDADPKPTTPAARDLLGGYVSGTVTTLTSTSLVIETSNGPAKLSR